MIEVELRGIIDEEDYKRVLDLFREKAKFVENKKRLSFIYFRHDINKDVREVRDDPIDLRVRITNSKKAEIILKYGKWGVEEGRREIFLPLKLEDFGEAVDFLKFLGWGKGVIVTTESKVFDYNGIEFAIVKSGEHYYFEAEKCVKCEEDIARANKEIKETCDGLGLRLADEEDFFDQINSMNNQEGNRFNFSKQSFIELKERFREWF